MDDSTPRPAFDPRPLTVQTVTETTAGLIPAVRATADAGDNG